MRMCGCFWVCAVILGQSDVGRNVTPEGMQCQKERNARRIVTRQKHNGGRESDSEKYEQEKALF